MRLVQKQVQMLIKEVAAEQKLPITVATDIVLSEFDFIRTEMSKGEMGDESSFKTVLIKYLGTFTFLKRKHSCIVRNIERLNNEKHSRELQSDE